MADAHSYFVFRFKQWNGRERSLYFELPAFYTPVEQLMESPKGGISVLQGKRVARIDAKAQLAYLVDGTTISHEAGVDVCSRPHNCCCC